MSNIYNLFLERITLEKKADAFILSPEGECQHTWADLQDQTARYAARLLEVGLGKGDRVMVIVGKSPQNLFLYLACLRIGAIYLPLNTAYTDRELGYFVENATPSLIVCDPARRDFFEGRLEGAAPAVLELSSEGEGFLPAREPTKKPAKANDKKAPVPASTPTPVPAPANLADDDPAVILYTSGTTGKPKGALITHGNLISNGQALHKAWQWQAGDILLHALPLFHVHGLFVATHLALLNASPIVFLPAFSPEQVIKSLPRATVYMGVPTNYVRLLATDKLTKETCRNMRLFTCGSAPLLPQTFEAFKQTTGFEIVERYGMTETGMNTSNPLDGARKPGTVGLPLPGVETRIADDEGSPVATGETGHLKVRGKNVFAGYWQMPDKTAEEFDDEGFFRTGDLASRDEDGYISIVGRGKDLIISGGLNVYPKEIEAVIDKLPGVAESAVIGLPHPDFGEGVCAVIVPEAGAKLTADEMTDALKGQLANFKVPKWVHFVDALPRNTMGKVQKNLLRERFDNAGDADDGSLRIGVLASHEGTNFQNIVDACQAGQVKGQVVLLITNNSRARVTERAAAAGVPCRHLSSAGYPDADELDAAILGALVEADVGLVVLAGYMKKLGSKTLRHYAGRIVNVHPSLLPKHGGRGMYGGRVHEAVLASGDEVTGATVHHVTEEYDEGAVILKEETAVRADDTVLTLAARVREIEHRLLIEAIGIFGKH